MKSVQKTAVLVLLGLGAMPLSIAPGVQGAPQAQPPAATVQAVNVRINGQAVPFSGQGAIQAGNAVLVPLRGIFEKLGADVKFDKATGSITAMRLDKTITLRIGDSVGFVNGEPRPLSTPAITYNGSIMVPLRFVSDALGGIIDWKPEERMVDITTDAVTVQTLPAPPANDSPVNGVLTGVYPEINALTVRIGADNYRVLLGGDVTVQMREVGGSTESKSLNSLRLNENVRVVRDSQGFARQIQVLRDLRRGVVKSKTPVAGGSTDILFTNGTSVGLPVNAPILMGTNVVDINSVKENDALVVRINLETGLGVSAAVVTENDPDPIPPEAGTRIEPEIPPIPPPINTPDPNPIVPVVTAPIPKAMTKPEITAVTHDAGNRVLKAGDVVKITVKGTPGGKGTAQIGGLVNARSVELLEEASEAGTYTASVTIPVGVTLKEAVVAASLSNGELITPMAEASERLRIDSEGPKIAGTGPADGAMVQEVRPRIYGGYSDTGGAVKPDTLKVYLNGKDITSQAEVTEAFFSYTPKEELSAGKVVVTVAIKDEAGNESRKEWDFTVAPPEKIVRSYSISPRDQALRSEETLTVRLEGMAGGGAKFKIGPLGELPMREDSPGVYIGTYKVKKGDSVTKAPVTILFNPPGKDPVTLTPPGTVTLAAGPPMPPIIDFPYEGAKARSGYIVLSGRATSDVKVQINISYSGKPLIGSTVEGKLSTVEVETDTQGNWKTPPILLDVRGGYRSMEFVAEVTAIREGNERSASSTVRFKK
ncbi:MAG: hypothetical protein OHK0029_02360 [Armatimonadaceae bacterium]